MSWSRGTDAKIPHQNFQPHGLGSCYGKDLAQVSHVLTELVPRRGVRMAPRGGNGPSKLKELNLSSSTEAHVSKNWVYQHINKVPEVRWSPANLSPNTIPCLSKKGLLPTRIYLIPPCATSTSTGKRDRAKQGLTKLCDEVKGVCADRLAPAHHRALLVWYHLDHSMLQQVELMLYLQMGF